MKLSATLTALTILFAGTAVAESRIDTLCWADHVNEVNSANDIVANPDGFYIRSLEVQLSYGDPRIMLATGNRFHLCTRSAATPDMNENLARLMMGERRVKYLFVPITCPSNAYSS